MLRYRMTTRRWVVAVAAVGGALSVARMGHTAFARWQIAESHELIRRFPCIEHGTAWLAMTAEERRKRDAYCQRLSAFHGMLERRYRRAAFRPWLPVPPDPPEPE